MKKTLKVSETFRVWSHLLAFQEVEQRPRNRKQDQKPGHDSAQHKEYPCPVAQPRNNDLALRKADALAQALRHVSRRRDRLERPREMRFEGVDLIVGKRCLAFAHFLARYLAAIRPGGLRWTNHSPSRLIF